MFTCSAGNYVTVMLICSAMFTCSDGTYNGMCLWMEYDLDELVAVSHGLIEPVTPGSIPVWNMERRQGISTYKYNHPILILSLTLQTVCTLNRHAHVYNAITNH